MEERQAIQWPNEKGRNDDEQLHEKVKIEKVVGWILSNIFCFILS